MNGGTDSALSGRIYLKRVGDALCRQPQERDVLTVRTKDLPRIVGVDDSRLKYIHARSKASIGVMVDLTAMRYYTAQIEVSGTRSEVRAAVALIEEAIREIYPVNSPRLAWTRDFLHYDSIDVDFPKAAFLLNDINLVDIESETQTWIEADVSRPHRVGTARQLHILVCGTRGQVNDASGLIRERIAQVIVPKGPGVVHRLFMDLWDKAKSKCCGQGEE